MPYALGSLYLSANKIPTAPSNGIIRLLQNIGHWENRAPMHAKSLHGGFSLASPNVRQLITVFMRSLILMMIIKMKKRAMATQVTRKLESIRLSCLMFAPLTIAGVVLALLEVA
jgi:hypothetical protein